MTQGTANLLLSALSINSRDRLLSHAVAMPIPLRTVLYEPNETPRYTYFITSGMASVVTTMRDGATAEVKLIGCEGVVGALHLLGPAKVATNAFMQIAGTGFRLPFHELQQAYRSNGEVRERILEYVQAQAVITDQIAGCNRLHDADARLARWLLMCQDRTQSDVLMLTQEFLAMMLGSMRTTVTVLAGALQEHGVIEYSRGKVKILDRAQLETAACECYAIAKQIPAGLYTHSLISEPPINLSSHVSNASAQIRSGTY